MPRTPAKRAADARYEAKTYKIVAVKVRKSEAAAFHAACAAEGTTAYAVLLRCVREMIARHADTAPPEEAGTPQDPAPSTPPEA